MILMIARCCPGSAVDGMSGCLLVAAYAGHIVVQMRNDMSTTADITTLIESIIRERFSEAAIDHVEIAEEKDFDGDPILRVVVVYDGKHILDAKKTSGLVRHIRHKLVASRESVFPILSFMSKSEAAEMKAAAA
jgi:hypothetical protein